MRAAVTTGTAITRPTSAPAVEEAWINCHDTWRELRAMLADPDRAR
jgi:hypothetical protein